MGTEVKFKKGDLVRCVYGEDPATASNTVYEVVKGRLYTVCEPRADSADVWLEESPLSWPASRFERADPVDVLPALASARPAIDGAGVKGCMTSPKDPLELIDPGFVLGISKVLLAGAKKYAPHNWLRGMSWATVFGGILRHLFAFFMGEELDPETGLPHLHHAACGIMFLSHYAHGPKSGEYRKLDDRVFKQEAA